MYQVYISEFLQNTGYLFKIPHPVSHLLSLYLLETSCVAFDTSFVSGLKNARYTNAPRILEQIIFVVPSLNIRSFETFYFTTFRASNMYEYMRIL